MLIALPVAAVIVVLLRHARDYYERSRLYDPSMVIIQGTSSGRVSVESEQVDVDVKIKTDPLKNLQDTEKNSKIEIIENKKP